VGRFGRLALPPLVSILRRWDRAAADRVDEFIAISRTVQRRIKRCYQRDAPIIYPPVRTDCFDAPREPEDYFLVVSRLIPYKRIDLAVRAFNQLGLPLRIVGDGRDRAALEAIAESNVRFLGHLPDEKMREQMARCRALLFPGEEDFGLTPVEAMAAGRPVIAYGAGGALDSIVEGQTGLFFHEQTPSALAEAVQRFDQHDFDPAALQRHAQRFGVARFMRELGRALEQVYSANSR
jgi:glycosyltransferase involved in cell wall biosynthesis